MIHSRYFTKQRQDLVDSLRRRNALGKYDIDRVREMVRKTGDIQPRADALKAERNRLSKGIGGRKKQGLSVDDELSRMAEISDEIGTLDDELRAIRDRIEREILGYPNILLPDVPAGNDEADNVVVREEGVRPEFSFAPLCHDELGARLGMFDFEAGAKISGAKFPVYRGPGAQFERALIQMMLDIHTRKNGYEEIMVPLLVNDDSMRGTGQYPKFVDEYYRLDKDHLSLIPTAEVPLTNLYRNRVIDGGELPIRITAASSCFRREAGSYGKETRGLIRVHQFQKVELVRICRADDSEAEHERLLADAESVLKELELPYRVVLLCGGDTSAASAKTYDLEVWMPGLRRYLEISSVSNFTDYQARRAMIRIRRTKSDKPEYAHTLNGSGLAAGRTLAAVIENYQTKEGDVRIPEALRPYLDHRKMFRRRQDGNAYNTAQ